MDNSTNSNLNSTVYEIRQRMGRVHLSTVQQLATFVKQEAKLSLG